MLNLFREVDETLNEDYVFNYTEESRKAAHEVEVVEIGFLDGVKKPIKTGDELMWPERVAFNNLALLGCYLPRIDKIYLKKPPTAFSCQWKSTQRQWK